MSELYDDLTIYSGTKYGFPATNAFMNGEKIEKSSGGFSIRKRAPQIPDRYNRYYWLSSSDDRPAVNSADYKSRSDSKLVPEKSWADYKINGSSLEPKVYHSDVYVNNKRYGLANLYLNKGYHYSEGNVLPGCVSYAAARFNEVEAEMYGTAPSNLPPAPVRSNTYSQSLFESWGLKTGTVAKPGSIAVCSGHHIFIEDVVDDGKAVLITHSANDVTYAWTPTSHAERLLTFEKCSLKGNTIVNTIYGNETVSFYVYQPKLGQAALVQYEEKPWPTTDDRFTFPAFGRGERQYIEESRATQFEFNSFGDFTQRNYPPRVSDFYNCLYWAPVQSTGAASQMELSLDSNSIIDGYPIRTGRYARSWMLKKFIPTGQDSVNDYNKATEKLQALKGEYSHLFTMKSNSNAIYVKMTDTAADSDVTFNIKDSPIPLFSHGDIMPSSTGYAEARYSEIYAERTRASSPSYKSKFRGISSLDDMDAASDAYDLIKSTQLEPVYKSQAAASIGINGAMMVWYNDDIDDKGVFKGYRDFRAAIVELDKDNKYKSGSSILVSYSMNYNTSNLDTDAKRKNAVNTLDAKFDPTTGKFSGSTSSITWQTTRLEIEKKTEGEGSEEEVNISWKFRNEDSQTGYSTFNDGIQFRGFVLQPDISNFEFSWEDYDVYLHHTVARLKYEDQLRVSCPDNQVSVYKGPSDDKRVSGYFYIRGIYKVLDTETSNGSTFYKVYETRSTSYWIKFNKDCMEFLPKEDYPAYPTRQTIYTSDLVTGNVNSDIKMFNSTSLISDKVRVQVPFVKVVIGDYTFGVYDKSSGLDETGATKILKVTYPNYITSLKVNKINGNVNTYTLGIMYVPNGSNDPNFMDKVFSKVGIGGDIEFTYGDCMVPTYMYKDEKAVITNISSSGYSFGQPLTYTVTAIGTGIALNAKTYTFNARTAKPSDVLIDILYNKTYGIQEIFSGMQDKQLNEEYGLIARDDKSVKLVAKSCTALEYINYLVRSMIPADGSAGVYSMVIEEDTKGIFEGSYFKVKKFSNNWISDIASYGMYSIDIGYPSADHVMSFSTSSSYTYTIYDKFAGDNPDLNYSKRIDDNGTITRVLNNPTYRSTGQDGVSPELQKWFAAVTAYPITASLKIKGLLRPSMLMQYIKVNVYYYGEKHVSSGIYVITSQEDDIGTGGFETSLSLTRIKGDDDYTFVDAKDAVMRGTTALTWEDALEAKKQLTYKIVDKEASTDNKLVYTKEDQDYINKINEEAGLEDGSMDYDGNTMGIPKEDNSHYVTEEQIVDPVEGRHSPTYSYYADGDREVVEVPAYNEPVF